MMKSILKPNLPSGKVCQIICGTEDNAILDFFHKKDIEVLNVEPNKDIDPAVSSHADMAALHLGGNRVIVDKSQLNLKHQLLENGFAVYETSEKIAGKYPDDIKLNFTVIGDKIIGNTRYADLNLNELVSDMQKIKVNQGYCKCSTLVVKENALITDDESIYHKMRENGTEALLVSKGDVFLKGHDYGFIGGASGKISNDTIVFFGNIFLHRDSEMIISFIREHGCSYLCTDNGPLRDIGGIIPLSEMN